MDGEFDSNQFQDDAHIIDAARDEFILFLNDFKPQQNKKKQPDAEEQHAGEVEQDAQEPRDSQEQPGSQAEGEAQPAVPPFYITKLEEMAERSELTLEIDMAHVRQHSELLAEVLQKNFVRIEPALRKAVQNVVRQHIPDYCKYENDEKEKEFYISVFGIDRVDQLRDLKTSKLGRLSAFFGTVTRTTEVRPELFMGTFQCMECNTKIENVEQQFKFTQPLICTNATCGNRNKWHLLREESTFLDWQRVRVQENTDEVPAGNLPRTMDVVLRGNMVERAKAGDKVLFTGSLIVVPEVAAMSAPGQRAALKQVSKSSIQGEGITGLKALGVRELHYKLLFLASHVEPSDSKSGMINIRPDDDLNHQDVLREMPKEDKELIHRMYQDRDIWDNLVRSLCPSVLGHNTIKQAVLLMLFGGVHKKTQEGISLRGDINVCIIGDPAVAKSQVLKYVASFLPRAIYTSGKSSTAAGLTASVVKDADSNEFCIEAGALMLADNGVCCIDEFDKMDIKDQVAIHEAMEQQTISLAKAGISATLNARASILAAANPIGGRYDKRKTLKQNIFLPPAILSRFDLLHVMMDEPTHDTDVAIAHHIIRVHQYKEEAFDVPYTTEQMQKYIRFARTIKPKITPEAKDTLVKAYKELRCEDAAPGSNTSYRMTVRQLEAMVRLSEALARVALDPEVKPHHVKEAKSLLRSSVLRVDLDQQLELDDLDEEQPRPARRPISLDTPQPMQTSQQEGEEDRQTAVDSHTQSGDENAGDTANQQTPSTSRPAKRQKVSQSTQPAPQAEGTPQQTPSDAPAPAKKKVNAREFARIKGVLVRLLRDKARATRLAQMDTEDQDMALGSTEQKQERVDVSQEMGLQQSMLLEQYMQHPAIRQQLDSLSATEVSEHYVLVHRIISHLIKREGIIVVVSKPLAGDDEPADEFLVRSERERIIALHPNFDPDNL